MLILLWLLGILIAIAVSYFLANCFYDIACEKGFEERKYFWISFLLGISGYLLVIALPDRKDRLEQTMPGEPPHGRRPSVRPSQPDAPADHWYCSKCGAQNPYDVIRCKCGTPKSDNF